MRKFADPLWTWLSWRCGFAASILAVILTLSLIDRQTEREEIADYDTPRESGVFTKEERDQRNGEDNIQLLLIILSIVAFPYFGYRLQQWGRQEFEKYKEFKLEEESTFNSAAGGRSTGDPDIDAIIQEAAEREDIVSEGKKLLGSTGDGMTDENIRAFGLFLRAAEAGHIEAQYSLGWCYLKGEGVQKDYARAIEWFRKAATKGFPKALLRLGCLYEGGVGCPKDEDEAIKPGFPRFASQVKVMNIQ